MHPTVHRAWIDRWIDRWIHVEMDRYIDEWIYTDKEGEEIKAMYNENPKNLLDVRYNTCDSQKCEHPFERMAIEISKMI